MGYVVNFVVGTDECGSWWFTSSHQSFASLRFSTGFKARFIILESLFVLLLVCAVPIGAHGTVVAVTIANLLAVAWFWYNNVRSVDVTSDGTLRFFIGNIEVEIPFDKVISIRRIATACYSSNPSLKIFKNERV